jgi:PAS domain S-box-containing protein
MAIKKNGTKQKNKPVILVVDDQPQNIELLEAYLVPQGYDVVKAVNGEEALETLSANKIDLILLDVTMPGMDGFEVTRRVRSDDKNRLLPIIMITALREREDRIKGIEAGCDDFLSKPVDKIELLARVQSLLKVKAYNDLASNYRKELEITQKSTDEALEYAESIINTVREPLIALDQDLRVITASRSFYETFKVKPEETVGQLIYDLGNNQWDIPKLRELLETILPQKTTFDNYEVEHEFSTIGRRVMLLNARQIQRLLGKERIILLAIEDVTERKKIEGALQTLEDKYHLLMEKALVISEETLHLVVEALIVGITVTDLQGTILQTNKAFVLLHGFRSKEEVIGRNILELINIIDHKKAQENMNKLEMEGYFKDVEFTLLKVDGSSFSAELSAAAIKDKSGNTQSIVFLTKDIAERKQREQESEKFTAELKEKNTELERFTYTVSHDLKSPLVTIKTFLGYLAQDMAAADAGRIEKDMLFMNGAADKMGKLLGELLEMSRVGRVVNPPAEVAFKELAEEAERIVAGPILEGNVQVRLVDEPVTLHGDRSRLLEIWQNLVENAVKFMGDQPSPQIDIGLEHHDGETVFFVRDNGIGIDPKYHSKLFHIFEKFNPKTEGTGMGLAITKRIVELYQGRIWVESKGEGQGSCFFFTLPGALSEKDKGE